MAAAEHAGGFAERAEAALAAGCDMILVCNHPQGAEQVLQALESYASPTSQMRLIRMHGRHRQSRARLHQDPRWSAALAAISDYQADGTLDLDL